MVYDAFLLLSFGGPEGQDDVLPFLENVTRGRGIPRERLEAVAGHYRHFGGVSPINAQCRELIEALRPGFELPIYWGNRNWHPMLADTVRQMRDDGVQRAIAFVTSPFGSYSSCRQYRDDIDRARAEVPGAPVIDKIRHYHDHPGYIAPHADAVRAAVAGRTSPRLVFTAHSIPTSMNAASGPGGVGRYQAQLLETARLVAAQAAPELSWDLVWQSRSGPPQVPWLEPDINDHLEQLAKDGVTEVVVSPIGFISDHLEVLWDLDEEAKATADRLGLDYVRAATPGADPRFVDLIRELVAERVLAHGNVRHALGTIPTWDFCPADCCVSPKRP
ncbi:MULTISPECIES: ferrochelatase [Dactylosporangium]|uniref:Coproporphyrin III ferrochelatase n=2 Tax=Dactylosporangium TaxID=35753 RepID=A0A9W6KGL0_9ACTN|nr:MULTISPECIES: ferrochelatase [Dactylosporangium]UAB98486.1 ferrochelatase [Dactylosporangium vinaceum]UWZ46739.1 ferrochelatase [Dactylosporangium matsuzakiense]GLL01697.1 ferrochelatase [Dactylosporangium matsuzakiense]